jgi:hypothetical protein
MRTRFRAVDPAGHRIALRLEFERVPTTQEAISKAVR